MKLSNWKAKLCYPQNHQPITTVNLDAHWRKVTRLALEILGRLLCILAVCSDEHRLLDRRFCSSFNLFQQLAKALRWIIFIIHNGSKILDVINYCNFTDRHAFTQSLMVNYGLMKNKLKDAFLTDHDTSVPHQLNTYIYGKTSVLPEVSNFAVLSILKNYKSSIQEVYLFSMYISSLSQKVLLLM